MRTVLLATVLVVGCGGGASPQMMTVSLLTGTQWVRLNIGGCQDVISFDGTTFEHDLDCLSPGRALVQMRQGDYTVAGSGVSMQINSSTCSGDTKNPAAFTFAVSADTLTLTGPVDTQQYTRYIPSAPDPNQTTWTGCFDAMGHFTSAQLRPL
jgi:hypothetical protein